LTKLLGSGERQSMKQAKYCLDTHPLIWYFTGQKTLAAKSKKIIDSLFLGKNLGLISVIVLLEAYHLGLRHKKFSFCHFQEKIESGKFLIVPLDETILEACYRLPKYLDIHDRVIAATSLMSDSYLITKDPLLQKVHQLKTVWQ